MIDGDDTIETEQRRQRGAVVGIEPAVDAHVRLTELGWLAGRRAVERNAHQAQLPIEIELGGAAGRRRPLDGQRAVQFCRRQAIGGTAQDVGRLRRKLPQHARQIDKRAGIEIDGDAAARLRRQFVDASGDVERGAAQFADRQMLDLQRAGIELDLPFDRARIDTGQRRFADIERQRALARRRKTVLVHSRLGKRRQGVEIELGGVKIGLDNGRTVGCRPSRRPSIGEASLDVFLIERGVEPVDRQTIARNGDVATRAQCPHAGRRCGATAAEPGEQRIGVGGVQGAGTCKSETMPGLRDVTAQAHLGEPRRAQFDAVQAPSRRVKARNAVQRLDIGAADREAGNADGELARQRRLDRRHEGIDETLDHKERRPVRQVGRGERAIDIDLERRNIAVEMRLFAECQIGFAGEDHRAFVRPVLKRNVVQRRRGRRRPDRAAGVPRVAHHPLAARQRSADRPRQRNGAVELRRAVIDGERAIDVGGQRIIGRIDAEPDPEPGVGIAAAAGNSIAIRFVADDERSFSPERPKQRADVAVERKLLQRQARARRGIGENDAAVFDAQPGDGQIFRAPSARRGRPVDGAGTVEREIDLRRHQARLGGLHLAADERPKPHLEIDRAGAQSRLPARFTDLDVAQLDARGRQDAGVDRTGHAHAQSGEAARLVLERRAEMIPIDNERRHQRRNQRQDDRNCQSEQRRLHGASELLNPLSRILRAFAQT